MKWIACKDIAAPKAPKGQNFAPVIFYGPEIGVCAGRCYPKRKRIGMWKSLQGMPYRPREVTHWMHMPESPDAASGDVQTKEK